MISKAACFEMIWTTKSFVNFKRWLKIIVAWKNVYRSLQLIKRCFELTYQFMLVVHPQQTHRRWINVETTLIVNVHQCCFNVDICLKIKVEPTYVYRRCFNLDKTTLKQGWKSYVDSMLMTQCCFNVDIRLKRKVESTHVHRCWENSIETTLSIFVVLRFTRKWLNNKTKLSFQV